MARILLADDNAELRTVTRKVLERAGHEVIEAADGAQALTLHRTTPADLVITDVYMPDTDGIEATIRLTQEFPGVPLIVMSGGGYVGRDDILKIAARLGAHHTLPKPFSNEELMAAVEAALGGSSP